MSSLNGLPQPVKTACGSFQNPTGDPVARVRSRAGLATTNIAYGGADGKTLYIIESETGSILTARMPVPGRPMYSHL